MKTMMTTGIRTMMTSIGMTTKKNQRKNQRKNQKKKQRTPTKIKKILPMKRRTLLAPFLTTLTPIRLPNLLTTEIPKKTGKIGKTGSRLFKSHSLHRVDTNAVDANSSSRSLVKDCCY